ncbi:GDSL-type esterase/lipase family protein [Paenarthrobacter sp. NPDC057355]|uniref:SGNH/GDSL hydrolase family protein n=1 Tax=Paenarthrobacter sp. NPDC057355 TaxID=3346105 RepID=UPI00363F2E38
MLTTITGTLLDAAGEPMHGYVTFTPDTPIVNVTDAGKTIPRVPVRADLDAEGKFTAELQPADAAGVNPQNFTYRASLYVYAAGQRPARPTEFSFTATDGATLDLADITPVTDNNGVPHVVGPAGPQGVQGPQGVAGPAGPQGVPGIADDASVKSLITNPATQTGAAVKAGFAPRYGLPDLAGKVIGARMLDRWVSDAFAPPPAVDTPVITFDAAGYGTLFAPKRVGDVANAALDMAGDTRFRYFGFPSATATPSDPTQFVDTGLKPGGATMAAAWPFSVEFETTSDIVQVKSRASTANPNQGIILVNGRLVSETRIQSTTAAGSWTRMRLTFPSTGWRRIQIIGLNPVFGSFGGVQVTAGHSVIRPSHAVKRRIAVIGDSFTDGSGVAPAGATMTETYALRLAYLMGADQVILAGIGGSGWVAQTGAETQSHFGARVAPVLAMNPDVIIFMGSRNDPTAVGVQAAVESALDACANVPEVYVTGTVTRTGFTAQNAAVKAGTEAKGRRFVDLAGIIYGSGKAGAPTNDGNADFFISGADGVHPTHEGHKYIARRFFQAIAGAYGQS